MRRRLPSHLPHAFPGDIASPPGFPSRVPVPPTGGDPVESPRHHPSAPDNDAIARMIGGRRIRIVGDVHGDLHAFRHAAATDRFLIQLGDLVDYGPDSVGTFRLMQQLIDERRGLFVLGNHDRKLARALHGRKMRRDPPLMETLAQFLAPENEDVRLRAIDDLSMAPAWIVLGKYVFVHGGFHVRMLDEAPPPGLGTVTPLLSRALFGETTGRMQKDGYPERRLNWVDHIPAGYTVYCGHDRRSTDGRPWVRTGRAGGTAIFTDTGAGKGGHLAWIDLPGIEPAPAGA